MLPFKPIVNSGGGNPSCSISLIISPDTVQYTLNSPLVPCFHSNPWSIQGEGIHPAVYLSLSPPDTVQYTLNSPLVPCFHSNPSSIQGEGTHPAVYLSLSPPDTVQYTLNSPLVPCFYSNPSSIQGEGIQAAVYLSLSPLIPYSIPLTHLWFRASIQTHRQFRGRESMQQYISHYLPWYHTVYP